MAKHFLAPAPEPAPTTTEEPGGHFAAEVDRRIEGWLAHFATGAPRPSEYQRQERKPRASVDRKKPKRNPALKCYSANVDRFTQKAQIVGDMRTVPIYLTRAEVAQALQRNDMLIARAHKRGKIVADAILQNGAPLFLASRVTDIAKALQKPDVFHKKSEVAA